MFFPVAMLMAQGTSGTEKPPGTEIFPLALVLEEAEHARDGWSALWQPDWPLDLPPDSFKVQHGEVSGVAVEGEGVSLVFRNDPEGRLEEFPLMLNGRMVQVSLVYQGTGEIKEMVLDFPSGEESWNLEFLEYGDFYPSLIRCLRGDLWYFISLFKGGNVILETWYDEEGNMLGAYGYTLTEVGHSLRIKAFRDYSNPEGVTYYFYDSRNFITESSGPNGVYRVLYFLEDLPRYWERRPVQGDSVEFRDRAGEGVGNFYLQWDERGFLLRIAEEPGRDADTQNNPADSLSPAVPVDRRYEYTLDEKGNWIERREIRMLHNMGLLVPSPGTTFTRVLEYKEPE